MGNIFEELRINKKKNNNEMERSITVADLVRDIKKKIPDTKIDRNKINRIENGSQPPDAEILIAYSKVFNVSTDYLLGLSPHCEKIDENKKMICEYLGLSVSTVEEIAELKPDYKMILDKMISRYSFLLVLPEIRNLLGYNSLKPHIKLLFDENSYRNGAEIDQFLFDAINDNAVATFFNETVIKRIKVIIDSTILDKDLQAYFGEKDKKSKIKSVLTSADLPRYNPETGKLE